jgi:DNA-binding transcriptional MerR regulator
VTGKWLKVGDIADGVGVHPETVRRWQRQGIIKAHHKLPGGYLIFTQDELDRLTREVGS